MQNKKEEVIQFVKKNGPVLPVHISKHTGLNLIFSGAILSELVATKQLKISNAKVGGSPMYYISGQEYKLSVLREHLSQRPKGAFDLLKDSKILRDKHCEPWQRVALREIKDFAVPLRVELKGIDEVFWKWHLLSNDDAKRMILSLISGELPKEEAFEKPPEQPQAEEPKKEEIPAEEHILEESAVPEAEEEEPDEPDEDDEEEEKAIPLPKEKPKEKQSSLTSSEKLEGQGEFYESIIKFMKKNEMSLDEQKVLRKNREMHFVVKIPSPVGSLTYFVKAKNKKKINEGELLLAFNEAANSKLPLLFLSSGEMTNKAEKYAQQNIRGMVFKKLK